MQGSLHHPFQIHQFQCSTIPCKCHQPLQILDRCYHHLVQGLLCLDPLVRFPIINSQCFSAHKCFRCQIWDMLVNPEILWQVSRILHPHLLLQLDRTRMRGRWGPLFLTLWPLPVGPNHLLARLELWVQTDHIWCNQRFDLNHHNQLGFKLGHLMQDPLHGFHHQIHPHQYPLNL